jgi:hypothetical protein
MKLVVAILTAGSLLPVALQADDLQVIVNPSVGITDISADDLKAIFLGTKTSLKNAGHLQPVLAKSGPALADLAERYLGKTESGLETYYRSLVFGGRWAMPPFFKTESEIVAYVAKTPGAIACVHSSALTAGVKELRLK